VRVSPGWVDTEATVAFVERIASQAGTDYEGGKQIIMEALDGIRLGRSSILEEVANLVALLLSLRVAAPSAERDMSSTATISTA
jgi:NAD(P)-dependent dehydrogenase (short-subunit alcohol dehydrogenase family)